MQIYCSPYTEDIEAFLKAKMIPKRRILYIVPTLILFQRRLKFYWRLLSKGQDFPTSNDDKRNKVRESIELYEIDEFLKAMISSKNQKILSKTESSIILERILRSNVATNHASWFSMIPNLNDLFTELSATGLNLQTLKDFDRNERWNSIIQIYEKFTDELRENNVQNFGDASLSLLETLDLSPYEELILDGAFLPLRNKHHRLILRFKEAGKPITIFLPFDLDEPQHPGYRAITEMYETYLSIEQWQSIQQKRPTSFFISRLPKMILLEKDQIYLDNSFHIYKFDMLEDELTFIIQEIKQLIRNKGVDYRKIVILTPNPMEMRPLIRELAEQYDLPVDIPRRPFIYTPLGQTLTALYNIRLDSRMRDDSFLDIPMFKRLLTGKFLKVAEGLDAAFQKIEVFFSDCEQVKEWQAMVESLIIAKDNLYLEQYQYHPLVYVTVEQLNELQGLIRMVKELSQLIVTEQEKTITDHLNSLIQFLKEDSRFLPIDPELLDRLNNFSSAAFAHNHVAIHTAEFGKRLTSIFTEPEDVDRYGNQTSMDEPQNVEEEEKHKLFNHILVTGLSNVEFQNYDYVFICRFTQDHYPEANNYSWPLNSQIEYELITKTTQIDLVSPRALEEFYLDRSLYYFITALNAARVQLCITYSRVYEGLEQSLAHYLYDIGQVFGIEEEVSETTKNKTLEELLEEANVIRSKPLIKPSHDNAPEEPSYTRVISEKSFTVEDVTIYNYCPRRFYYTKKHPDEAVFSNLFHLQTYAAACLYERAIECLVQAHSKPMREVFEKKHLQGNLIREIPEIRKKAEEYIRPLFPLNLRIWESVRLRAEYSLRSLIDFIFQNGYVQAHEQNGNAHLKLTLKKSNQTYTITIGDYSFLATRELEVNYGGKMIQHYSTTNLQDFLYFGTRNLDEQEEMQRIKDWYFRFKREFYKEEPWVKNELINFTNNILEGNFTKHVGGHCKFCAFKDFCQEREVH